MKTRSCKHCGEMFEAKTYSSTKYCDYRCRFFDRIANIKKGDECWEWPWSINAQTGYGQFVVRVDGKPTPIGAHRISWEAHNSPIPDGLYVLHKCDNRRCINPNHLFLGTQLENVQDMKRKGRARAVAAPIHWTKLHPHLIRRGDDHPLRIDPSCMPRGEANAKAKLTESNVIELRTSDLPLSYFAKKFGVTAAALSEARRGRTWAHVKCDPTEEP